ncbi:TolC family protein [Schnuerera sp. xch1]|uniref:TolC family protein n=1 Tax=Schnuerera sp. xch1 TaxID=2874283 RepID=UPI001CBD240F|nr:TolC family protein [Schnuerera sp. xch1]MBZ2173996.1 TolC family protein [Schnuerera sp. xch1]
MRKIKWILVLAIILIAVPTYAHQVKSGKKIHKLQFEDIETLIMERNPTIQINKNMRKNLNDNKNDIEDAIEDAEDDKEDLEDAIDQMDETIGELNQKIKELEVLKNSLDYENDKPEGNSTNGDVNSMDDGSDTDLGSKYNNLYKALEGTIIKVQELYQSNIMTLTQNKRAMRDQLEDFDKEIDKLPNQKIELDKTILQLEMVNESTVWGAQNLYLGYTNLQRQRDELAQNLELLDDQIDIMNIQQELGMVTPLEVSGIENQREQMVISLETLETQMDNIKGELNLMLGQDFDTPLKLEDELDIDEEIVSDMDYEDDLELAKKNSYSLELKTYDYRIQDNNEEWADDYGNYGDYRVAERNSENATIELDQERKNVELAFHKAYEEVHNKITALENEKRNLEYQQQKYDALKLRYELEMISKIEWKQGKAEYDSQKNKVETAQQDLLQAWLQYEAFVEGMNFQQQQ